MYRKINLDWKINLEWEDFFRQTFLLFYDQLDGDPHHQRSQKMRARFDKRFIRLVKCNLAIQVDLSH